MISTNQLLGSIFFFVVMLAVYGYQHSIKIDPNDQTQISGTLREISCHGTPAGRHHGRSTSCLLYLNESPRQLTLDSDTYKMVMHGQIPGDLHAGARIDVSVSRAEWQPSYPGRVEIHGLTVNGVKSFGVNDFSKMRSQQRRIFGFLLLCSAASMAYCFGQLIIARRSAR